MKKNLEREGINYNLTTRKEDGSYRVVTWNEEEFNVPNLKVKRASLEGMQELLNCKEDVTDYDNRFNLEYEESLKKELKNKATWAELQSIEVIKK